MYIKYFIFLNNEKTAYYPRSGSDGRTSAVAKDKIYHSADVLPATAQKTLKSAFPKAAVNRVKVDESLFGNKEYEVILSNGTEIEFNKEGDWKEVDCGRSAVPAAFIPAAIRTYVKTNHKGCSVIKIDKDTNDYDVELSNGVEMKFDRSGKFLRYDD